MKLAIFGGCSTGKTTTARLLSEDMGFPTRECGTVVRDTIRKLNITSSDLSDDCHRRIDNETLEWVKGETSYIVEGRYLDQVLAPLGDEFVLVRLHASLEERANRCTKRTGNKVTVEEISGMDAGDSAFRDKMYGSALMKPKLDIDSTSLSPEECAQQLITFLNRMKT